VVVDLVVILPMFVELAELATLIQIMVPVDMPEQVPVLMVLLVLEFLL
jgi:hypothetical protein